MPHQPKAFDELPDSALLRAQDLMNWKLWPGGRSSLWLAVREGRFPQPYKPYPGTTVWKAGDVRMWQSGLTPKASDEEALA